MGEEVPPRKKLDEFEKLIRIQSYQNQLSRQRSKAHYREINPFRGLESFDSKHAACFYGRTKTIEEMLDVLQQQAAAKKPFILLLGPRGFGKTSLVRAGILPVLTQVGTLQGDESCRHALTRPAAGGKDPFNALAAALLSESALPEFPGAKTVNGSEKLATDLRERPERVAQLLRESLDRLSLNRLNRLPGAPEYELALTVGKPNVGLNRQKKSGGAEPKVQLALIVDQLEELFAVGIAPELQQSYLAALAALVRCQRIFVIATLRSDFYESFLRSCYPDNFAVLSGRFELPPPTAVEIGQMIHLPSEASGLHFEEGPKTGQKLSEAVLEAATFSAEPLPLVEHLLSQLYQKQMLRGDGLLRWSDYCEMGELEGALAHHAENVFLALDEDAQNALGYVIRRLVSPGQGRESFFIRHTFPYQDLVSTPEFYDQKAGAKELIDRFIKEGFFHAEAGPSAERYVTVTQEALLWKWPRVRQLLEEDQGFLRMRDRLDADLKLWLSRGRMNEDLLSEPGLREAKTLVRGFRTSLSDAQLDYFQKSQKAQERSHLPRKTAMLAVIMGLALVITVPAVKWLNAEVKRQKAEALMASQRDALQAQLKDANARAQQIQTSLELVTSQRDALQSQLKDTEARAQQAQKDAALASSQQDALQTQLKESEANAQQTEKNMDLMARERDAQQSQLEPAPGRGPAAMYPKSEQTEPANLGLNPERSTSTQPPDSGP